MSYAPGTVLARKTPFEAPADDAPDLRPYNEIQVIGPSPVQTGVRNSEWTGQLGSNVSVKPTSFGEVVDRPLGELQRDYEVVSIPPPREIQRGVVPEVQPGPSPEEVFAAAAAEARPEPAAPVRRRPSPDA